MTLKLSFKTPRIFSVLALTGSLAFAQAAYAQNSSNSLLVLRKPQTGQVQSQSIAQVTQTVQEIIGPEARVQSVFRSNAAELNALSSTKPLNFPQLQIVSLNSTEAAKEALAKLQASDDFWAVPNITVSITGSRAKNFFTEDIPHFFTDTLPNFFEDDVADFITEDVGDFFSEDVPDFFEGDFADFFTEDIPSIFSRRTSDNTEEFFEDIGDEIDDFFDRLETQSVGSIETAPDPLLTSDSQNIDAQWALAYLQLEEAWDFVDNHGTNAPELITVAVIDSGLNYLHDDIFFNVQSNTLEVEGLEQTDDDNNQLVDDLLGWDFAESRDNPADTLGHGTHVAGIIGARSQNGQGISGFSKDNLIRVLPLKVFEDGKKTGDLAAVFQAIEYAATQGAQVINMSIGADLREESEEAIADLNELSDEVFGALIDQDIVLIAAAGNDGDDTVNFPASLENVLAVAANDWQDGLHNSSNFGQGIELSAPGVHILSLRADGTDPGSNNIFPGNTTFSFSTGTSMAAPHASGTAALLLSHFPELSADQVQTILVSSALQKASMPSEIKVLNTLSAVSAAFLELNPGETLPELNIGTQSYVQDGPETIIV